jgi:hypothetical protein
VDNWSDGRGRFQVTFSCIHAGPGISQGVHSPEARGSGDSDVKLAPGNSRRAFESRRDNVPCHAELRAIGSKWDRGSANSVTEEPEPNGAVATPSSHLY